MHIEILNIAQIPQAGIHIELVEFLRGKASFVDAEPIDEIRNEFIVSPDAIKEAIKHLEGIGKIVQSIQARDLYDLIEPFHYLMLIN
jgi:predicted RNA-binding protein (virulence factor B family)